MVKKLKAKLFNLKDFYNQDLAVFLFFWFGYLKYNLIVYNGLFITLVRNVFDNVFLFVGLATLGTEFKLIDSKIF